MFTIPPSNTQVPQDELSAAVPPSPCTSDSSLLSDKNYHSSKDSSWKKTQGLPPTPDAFIDTDTPSKYLIGTLSTKEIIMKYDMQTIYNIEVEQQYNKVCLKVEYLRHQLHMIHSASSAPTLNKIISMM